MSHRPGQILACSLTRDTEPPLPLDLTSSWKMGLSLLPPLGQVGLGPPQKAFPSHIWGGLEERRSPRPREPGDRVAM